MPFDAVLIPGGGLTSTGEPLPWVCARLDAALAVDGDPLFVALSTGTVHKPASAIESVASAEYLMARGITRERIFVDKWSHDTIGNAYFARCMHCEPRSLRRLLVITSAFHMPRTRAIFEWVFSLPATKFTLEFQTTPDSGMAPDALAARIKKEAASLTRVNELRDRIRTLEQLHNFMFTEHEVYATGLTSTTPPGAWLGSY
jgi:hypothetical protein